MRIKTKAWVSLGLFLVPIVALCYTTTSNMSLKTPASGDTDYPQSISDSFTLIDQHDHSAGKGVIISASGIASNSVTTVKILDGAVTQAKLAPRPTATPAAAAGEIAVSSTSGNFSTSSTTAVAITNFGLTLTTTGRPVRITAIGIYGANSFISIGQAANPAADATGTFLISRNASAIDEFRLSFTVTLATTTTNFASATSCSFIDFLDFPAAGTHVYDIKASVSNAAESLSVNHCKMIAYEI